MLWTLIVILLIFWLFGFLAHIGGDLIHILLFLVIIGVVYNLIQGRRIS